MFELRLELWALQHAHETDQHQVVEKQAQVNAVLDDILKEAGGWQKGGLGGLGIGGGGGGGGGGENWTDDELPYVLEVREGLGRMRSDVSYGVGVGAGWG